VVVAALAAAGSCGAQVQGYPIEPAAPLPGAVVGASAGVSEGPPAWALQPPSVTLPPGCATGGPCPPGDGPLDRGGHPLTVFPRTLLWEPPLASLREARFLGMPTGLSNGSTSGTAETSIGTTLGLLRLTPRAHPVSLQFDAFAVVHSRFADYDALVATDYRVGLPVSAAWGPWHGKIGYEHTSTHLGDEIQALTGQQPFDFIKDELVLGLGRYVFDERARVYGQAGWAFSQSVPGDPSPFRFAVGAEWAPRRHTGYWGRPFAAANVDFDGAVDYNASASIQAGWMWRDPARRLSQFRVFGQYYTGYSPYGQFYDTREDWFGFGLAMDY